MSDDTVSMTEVERENLDSVALHRQVYLGSGGREGYVWDFSHIGGHAFTTTLLLETVGRRTGERRIVPLIYGDLGGEVLIVASKGGADVHPAWYLNLAQSEEVTIQIATQAFRATWREPKGGEHDRIWAFMADIYPPYPDYQAATQRRIPLIALRPGESVDVLGD